MRKNLLSAVLLAVLSICIFTGCGNTTEKSESETKTTISEQVKAEASTPAVSLDEQLGYKRILGSFKNNEKIYTFKEDGTGTIEFLPLDPDGPRAPISFAQNKTIIFISAYALDDVDGYVYTYDGTNLTLDSANGEKIELEKVQ